MNFIYHVMNMQGIQQKNDDGGNKTMELTKRRMNLLFNQKGLTLIELLAVIVILAIISAIAIPAIGGIINGSKSKAQTANALVIISAARYAALNGASTKAADGSEDGKYSLIELKASGYLENIPMDPDAATKGDAYDETRSLVTPTLSAGVYSFTITLVKADGLHHAYFTTVAETDLLADKVKPVY